MDRRRFAIRLACAIVVPVLAVASLAAAQTSPSPQHPAPAASAAAPAPVPSDRDVAETQKELIRLLRLSPTLTTVVSRDPSLLSNQDYVARNNPQLAAFLTAHPEVARNPDFYLFTHMNRGEGQRPNEALERAVWPDVYRSQGQPSAIDDLMKVGGALLALGCVLGTLIWLIGVFLENRRWSRAFKLQSEVHGKLIDRFSSNQELATYMETEAGKRFLEAAPIPVSIESTQRVPNAVARVLTPLQIGIVLVLLGIGLLLLRHAGGPEMRTPMLFFGTVALMPGIGFIISAGITWLLAARLGLMPENPAAGDSVRHSFSSSALKDRQ